VDVEAGKSLKTFEGQGVFSSLAVSPDGMLFALAGSDQTIQLSEAKGGEKTISFSAAGEPVVGLSFPRERAIVYVGAADAGCGVGT